MNICKDKVVSIHYTLTDGENNTLDSSAGQEPLVYMQGHQNLIPGLEEALEGKTVGDKLSVSIPPEKGYGLRDDKNMLQVNKDQFQNVDDIQIGMEVQTQSEQGIHVYRVSKIFGDSVILDGNHPLAGVTLNFDVEVMDLRDANAEEIEHGHVHGPDGHHHH